jgi:hypothetical protein
MIRGFSPLMAEPTANSKFGLVNASSLPTMRYTATPPTTSVLTSKSIPPSTSFRLSIRSNAKDGDIEILEGRPGSTKKTTAGSKAFGHWQAVDPALDVEVGCSQLRPPEERRRQRATSCSAKSGPFPCRPKPLLAARQPDQKCTRARMLLTGFASATASTRLGITRGVKSAWVHNTSSLLLRIEGWNPPDSGGRYATRRTL